MKLLTIISILILIAYLSFVIPFSINIVKDQSLPKKIVGCILIILFGWIFVFAMLGMTVGEDLYSVIRERRIANDLKSKDWGRKVEEIKRILNT